MKREGLASGESWHDTTPPADTVPADNRSSEIIGTNNPNQPAPDIFLTAVISAADIPTMRRSLSPCDTAVRTPCARSRRLARWASVCRPSTFAGALMVCTALFLGGCTGGSIGADSLCAANPCETGEKCSNGVCVPDSEATPCEQDTDCVGNALCRDGLCTLDSTVGACAGISCDSGKSCLDGVCVSDDATGCTADGDCGTEAVCIDTACVSTDVGTSELSAENPDVLFGLLGVGQSYALIAPAPRLPTETDTTTETGTNEDVVATRIRAALSGKPADEACSCLWSVTPLDSVLFSTIDACATDMTPDVAGTMTISVAVTCPDGSGTFSQQGVATVPPPACNTNTDCADNEQCVDNVCQRRTGPVMTLLANRSRSPFLMVFDLRLEDKDGQPIANAVSRDNFRVIENDTEVNFAETGYSVTPAPNLPMRVVLVLDYTLSMKQAGAIESMTASAREFILADHFTSTNSIGVVEFHDRTGLDAGFSVVAPLTRADEDGKTNVANAIPLEGELEAGLSRAWDAVSLAISLLAATELQPGERRAVVFLTDGLDTTSDVTPEEVQASAMAADTTLYPVGFGDDVASEDLLRSLADATGGRYFAAENADALSSVFSEISDDLRGQWTFGYVTQFNTGTIAVQTEFTWDGNTTSFDTEINLAALGGDIHASVIEVADRSYDATTDRTSFVLNAAYVPRNINRWRLFLAQPGATFTLPESGGLISPDLGWSVIPSGGTYDLAGATSIEFGAFGILGSASVPGSVEQLQVTHDDSIYESLPQPKSVVFEGSARLAPVTLTAIAEPITAGVVTITPNQLAYAIGDVVTVSAAALGDYVFEKWTGGATGSDFTTTVTMDVDRAVTAVFYPPRTITVTVTPTTGGTVTLSPSKSTYRHGEIVQLTATASGTTFSGWSGDATGTTTTITVTMDGDKAVTATFTP